MPPNADQPTRFGHSGFYEIHHPRFGTDVPQADHVVVGPQDTQMRSIGLEIVRTADRLNFSAAVAVFSTDGPLPIYVIVHVRRQDMAALTRTVNIALKVYLILARKIFQIGVTKQGINPLVVYRAISGAEAGFDIPSVTNVEVVLVFRPVCSQLKVDQGFI